MKRDYPMALEKMLEAWNADGENVREFLEEALADDVVFVDPNHQLTGIDAFEAMVLSVNESLGSPVYSRRGRVDYHNNVCRYHWAVHVNGELLLPGFDVTTFNKEGKVSTVYGFFGQLPDEV